MADDVRFKPSRKDVAERAGVTETIVSYVINNNRCVKKEKKDRVLAAIKELNYKPNRYARALKGKSTHHVMILLDRIRTEAVGELVTEIERNTEGLGYLTSVAVIENTESFARKILDWDVDAVIINSINFDSKYINMIKDAGVAVILIENRRFDGVENVTRLNTGLESGSQKCVQFLYDAGCRKIAYADRISSRNHFSDESDFRYKGYIDKIKELGLAPYVLSGCSNIDELENSLSRMMKEDPIDGIFCRNDEVAFIVMASLQRLGYRIPEDISVIGLDNTSYGAASIPRLTTLKISRKELAREAVAAIEKYINEEEVPDRILFEPSLIIRESVKPIKDEAKENL